MPKIRGGPADLPVGETVGLLPCRQQLGAQTLITEQGPSGHLAQRCGDVALEVDQPFGNIGRSRILETVEGRTGRVHGRRDLLCRVCGHTVEVGEYAGVEKARSGRVLGDHPDKARRWQGLPLLQASTSDGGEGQPRLVVDGRPRLDVGDYLLPVALWMVLSGGERL